MIILKTKRHKQSLFKSQKRGIKTTKKKCYKVYKEVSP